MFGLHVDLCTLYMQQCPQKPEEGVSFPGTELQTVASCCEGAGNQVSSSSLEEQQPVMLTSELPSQPPLYLFGMDGFIWNKLMIF